MKAIKAILDFTNNVLMSIIVGAALLASCVLALVFQIMEAFESE